MHWGYKTRMTSKCRRVIRIRFVQIMFPLLVVYFVFNKYFQPVQFIYIHRNVNSSCVLPDLDPFDKSILKYIYHPNPIDCDPEPSLLYIDSGGKLQLNTSIMDKMKLTSLKCTYHIVKRLDDHDVSFLPGVMFTQPVYIPADCVRVKCSNNGKTIQDGVLYNIDHKSILENKKIIKNESTENLSVYIFGFDSVSRLAAERTMPKTMNFIREKLKGHVFKGYTTVGGNTFPNLIAALTGKKAFSKELPQLDTKTEFIDSYPFIWKDFTKRNYVTLYSEDYPEIAVFSNNMRGFMAPPTDHYHRTYFIARRKVNPIQNNIETFKLLMYLKNKNIQLGKYSPLCYKGRPKHVLHMDHLGKFISTYKNYRKFAFSWLCEVSHGSMNLVELFDIDTMEFFRNLSDEGHLNNSVLIFMSDHGQKYDEIRNTAHGRIEDRMPLLSIVIPDHIKQMHPHLEKNVIANENRLTSPYDLHETLMDIVSGNFKNQKNIKARPFPRGISLFSNIPNVRSCADASISEHLCACYFTKNVDIHSYVVTKMAAFAVNAINKELSVVKHVCSKLKVNKIIEAQRVQTGVQQQEEYDPKTIWNIFYQPEVHIEQRFLIVFETVPGYGFFEATILFTDINNLDSYKLLGDVSRTNKYSKQSHCVESPKLKPICYCKRQIE